MDFSYDNPGLLASDDIYMRTGVHPGNPAGILTTVPAISLQPYCQIISLQ